MMNPHIKRVGAALIAGFYLFGSTGVLAAAACGSNPTSALAVTSKTAKIALGVSNDCTDRVVFYNSAALGANDEAKGTKVIWVTDPVTGQKVRKTVTDYKYLEQAKAENENQTECVSISTAGSGTSAETVKPSGILGSHATVVFNDANWTSTFQIGLSDNVSFWTSAGSISFSDPVGQPKYASPENIASTLTHPAATTPGSVEKTTSSYIVTMPGGDYGNVSISAGTKIKFTGPVRIRNFDCNATQDGAGVEFYPGENYFEAFSQQKGCSISIASKASSSNPVVLNIKGTASGTTTFTGNCINFTPADGNTCQEKRPAESVMAGQNSSSLEINVINGNLAFQNAQSIAANIYVQSGTTSLGTGPFTLVGSIVSAGDISTQANDSNFYFKPKPGGSVDISAYSLSPPAVEKISQTGSIIYRTMQADYQADGSLGTSGHLKAFKLKSDSTQEADALWDAADRQTVTSRNEKIRTQVAGSFSGAASDFELLSSTAAAAFSGTVGVETLTSSAAQILDPTNPVYADKLGGRDKTALLGTPWRTNPIIVGKSVLFATDDGILYSVKAGELADGGGALNWGWIPRQLLPHTAKYDELALKHPWGQIAAITQTVKDSSDNYVTETYVVGTAMGGQVHFSIKVSADGDVLQGVSWLDDSVGKFSPGSASLAGDTVGVKAMSANWQGIVGGPSGGAAPTPAAADSGGDPLKVAYVYGDSTAGVELMVRRLDGKDASVPTAVKFKTASGGLAALPAAAAPVVKVSSNLLYVTDDAIYFGTSSGRIERSDTTGQLVASPGDKDLLITDPILNVNGAPVASGNGSGVVLTAQTARRLTVLKYVGGTWTAPVWWTGLSASGDAESSGENVPKIVTGAGYTTKITAAPDIVNGKVIMYVTKTKAIDSCTTETKGYAFGPLDLLTGAAAPAGSTFKVTENIADNLMNLIGDGQSVGGSGTIFNGKTGVLTGSSKDTGLLAPGAGQIKQRLNWRELTNFF